ncbi:P-loop containing nucleoside triphosphate hydrolase protein [Obba rivulosa]|uniref:P-loop containing nucleoside triphosphate hydrolase protein n=1 Tax=Obba rivulosa TaxID=1052685 RepID=A0A8E2ASA4_9APHY|nr:P-loop containing nucleoside triphosphate hydrolase protein [Obba rivulosa]
MSEHAFQADHQVVLLLVGFIGSGKSTFAQALEQHFPRFRRCNQDDLGDRRRVEATARQALSQGLSVCIDRTNIDVGQRKTWINIAREFPETQVWVIVFDTPYEVCMERLRERTNHPTIRTPEHGYSILARFRNQYEPPVPWEGHSRLIKLKPSDHPSATYTAEDISAILRRLQASKLEPAPYAPIDSYFVPGNRRGGSTSSGFHGHGSPGDSRGNGYRGGSITRGHGTGRWNRRGTAPHRGRDGRPYPSARDAFTEYPASVGPPGSRYSPSYDASHRDSDAQSWRS